MAGRTYTDEQLAAAIARSRSWRGVLRELGLAATSSASMRSVKAHAERLHLDHTHFTGQRRWTDAELGDAVARSSRWVEVADRLGLTGGSALTLLKGHAARLNLDVEHLAPRPHTTEQRLPVPAAAHLARSGASLAAGWLSLCGYTVSWPLEPAVYDLLVARDGAVQRIQVKTTTVRAGSTWIARITRSGRGHETYDLDEIDAFFVVDGDLSMYLIPAQVLGGLQAIHVAAYSDYRIVDAAAAGWRFEPSRPSS